MKEPGSERAARLLTHSHPSSSRGRKLMETISGIVKPRGRSLRSNESAKGPILAVLVLFAVVLLVVGIVFFFAHPLIWATPIGFVLAAATVFGIVGIVSGGGKAAVVFTVALALATGADFIGHYLGYF